MQVVLLDASKLFGGDASRHHRQRHSAAAQAALSASIRNRAGARAQSAPMFTNEELRANIVVGKPR
jgi:hypothetical protein